MSITRNTPLIYALLAALCFGASTPLTKWLLGHNIDPVVLAAFLYLGSGIGLVLMRGVQRLTAHPNHQTEAPMTRRDIPWLLGAVFAGGVAAPIVLMISLQHTPAATASLLLNFEGVATTVIATMAFREYIGARVWWAIGIITLACITLSVDLHAAWGLSAGALGVLIACILWGVDNNFTRQIAEKNPLTIVMVKGLGAGAVSLCLAWFLQKPLPSLVYGLAAMALGVIGYGMSIVFFILAMRTLGAARTSGYFASAPFIGMLLSLLFHEHLTSQFLLAVPLLIVGVVLLANEAHEHTHRHTTESHEHVHRHDDDHHAHPHEIELTGSHTHTHTHTAFSHTHPHTPDLHHRHSHA